MIDLATPKTLLDVEQRLRALMLRLLTEVRVDKAAHDTRNALSVIVMYRELVTDETCDSAELGDDIEHALAYADELLVRLEVPPVSKGVTS
jgi:hypothetical protein